MLLLQRMTVEGQYMLKGQHVLKLCLMQTQAVAMLSKAAELCDDDTRLQRIIPYMLVRAGTSRHLAGCSMWEPCDLQQAWWEAQHTSQALSQSHPLLPRAHRKSLHATEGSTLQLRMTACFAGPGG